MQVVQNYCKAAFTLQANWRSGVKQGEAKRKGRDQQTQANSGLYMITDTAYVPCRKFLLILVNRQQ